VAALPPGRGELRITHSFAGCESYSNSLTEPHKCYFRYLPIHAIPTSLLPGLTIGANADYYRSTTAVVAASSQPSAW
jgi:hypothetical protein